MSKIYESPDGGKTVFVRESGQSTRTLVNNNRSLHDSIMESKMWGEIQRMGDTHPAMREELDRVIMLYHLLKEHK